MAENLPCEQPGSLDVGEMKWTGTAYGGGGRSVQQNGAHVVSCLGVFYKILMKLQPHGDLKEV